jgi:hypothetical protein
MLGPALCERHYNVRGLIVENTSCFFNGIISEALDCVSVDAIDIVPENNNSFVLIIIFVIIGVCAVTTSTVIIIIIVYRMRRQVNN